MRKQQARTALDIGRQLAPTAATKTVEIDGHQFTIKRFAALRDRSELERRVANRQENLEKLHGGATPIVVTPEDVAGFEPLLPDMEPDPDNKDRLRFFLTCDREIQVATILEQGVVEPEMPYNVAAIYTRCLGELCLQLVEAIGEMNSTDAKADAKNDSTQTPSES